MRAAFLGAMAITMIAMGAYDFAHDIPAPPYTFIFYGVYVLGDAIQLVIADMVDE